MRNTKSRRSIIDHTTTCPYCGHRVLPKNLPAHIEKIHPGEHSDEKFTVKLEQQPKMEICPYCRREIRISALEEHIREEHSDQIRKVDISLARQNLTHHAQKINDIKKRTGADEIILAESSGERDPEAPWEWRLAERSKQPRLIKGKTTSNKRLCPLCGHSIRIQSFREHIEKAHGKKLEDLPGKVWIVEEKNCASGNVKAKQKTPSPVGLFECPVCKVKLKTQIRLDNHLTRVHTPSTDVPVPRPKRIPTKEKLDMSEPDFGKNSQGFFCLDCRIRFSSQERLDKHNARIHHRKHAK